VDKLTTKQLDHIAKLIMAEVSYFNGWRVSEDSMESSCFKAACKVSNYLDRKQARENRLPTPVNP